MDNIMIREDEISVLAKETEELLKEFDILADEGKKEEAMLILEQLDDIQGKRLALIKEGREKIVAELDSKLQQSG